MTSQEILEIQSQIRHITETTSVSNRSIADEISVSPAALSQFMNGKYQGDNQSLASKLSRWLGDYAKRQAERFVIPNFVETQTSRRIFGALGFAQTTQCITVVYGYPGVGKTKAIQQFAKEANNAWLITASPSRATLPETLFEIALELGLNDAPRRSGSLGRLIKKRMKGSNGLLMIDEADHLNYSVLEELRILQEECEIGLALVGNHQTYSRMTGDANSKLDFARLSSRIAKKVSVLKPWDADIKAIATQWRLTEPEEYALVEQIAKNESGGALRTLNHTLRLASIFAKQNDEAINASHIKLAIKDLTEEK